MDSTQGGGRNLAPGAKHETETEFRQRGAVKALDVRSIMLRECISQTLMSVLGASPAEALLRMLGFTEWDDDPQTFSRRLHELLGNGAHVIERLAIRAFYARLNCAFDEHAPFDFVKCVRDAGGAPY